MRGIAKKMKIYGLICEFNPFHSGHEYILHTLREHDADIVMCVMSGCFVQRGEGALCSPYHRAASAIRGGADIVLELPAPYSFGGVEAFASAGVGILAGLGVDTLAFGSESGDGETAARVARVTLTSEFTEEYKRLCRAGLGGGEAYFSAYKNITGEESEPKPNDILAIAYLREILTRGNMSYDVIKRAGADYDAGKITDAVFQSATALRAEALSSGLESIEKYIPEYSFDELKRSLATGTFGSQMKNIERAIISHLRICEPKPGYASSFGGLYGRLCRAALGATDYDGLCAAATSANYTSARVRRAILSIMLGVTDDDMRAFPAYTRLYAASRRGREYLNSIRRDAGIPIVTKPADASAIVGGERQTELTRRAEALWCMTLPRPIPADTLIKSKPYIE